MLLFEVGLYESQKYNAMFSDTFRRYVSDILGTKHRDQLTAHVNEVSKVLKKDDRILWFIRLMKLNFLALMTKKYKWWTAGYEQFEKKEINKFNKAYKLNDHNKVTLNNLSYAEFASGIEEYLLMLNHYYSMDIPSINDYDFGGEDNSLSIDGVIEDFSELESIWNKTNKSRNITDNSSEWETVIDFGDGFVWFDLGVPICDVEGRAMGHCGNAGSSDADDVVFSLREKNKNPAGATIWKPHLTFIYNSREKSFGEMKGYKNHPPKIKYHKYIVPLIELDMVNKLAGGGYKPKNNFKITDLEDRNLQVELVSKKPGLANLDELIELAKTVKKGNWPEIEQYILDSPFGTNDYLRVRYALLVKNGNWPEIEKKILDNGDIEYIMHYSGMVKDFRQWPEAEAHLRKAGNQEDIDRYVNKMGNSDRST